MEKFKGLVLTVIFLISFGKSVIATVDLEHFLNTTDNFLIRQMDVFDPVRPSNQPPLIQTYGWNMVMPYEPNNTIGRPVNLPYRGDIYDLSGITIYFISRSHTEPNYLNRAKKLLDTILFLQDHDIYPDGRTHAAAWANNLLYQNYSSIFAPDIGAGNLAWQGIALTRYYYALPEKQKNPIYLNAAIKTAQWILDHCKTGDPNNYPNDPGGFSGGLMDWNYTPATWRSTEHNIDIYVLGKNLYRLTSNPKWETMAQHAQKFVKAMYDPQRGCYLTGTLPGSNERNLSPIPADIQCWGLLAGIDDPNKMVQALNWLAIPGLDTDNPNDLLISEEIQGHLYYGVKFSDRGNHIQAEMTASAAMACILANRISDATALVESLDLMRCYAAPQDDGLVGGEGIVATPEPTGAPTGFSNATYPNLLHSASSAWTGLTVLVLQGDKLANPLMPLPIPGDFNYDSGVNLDDFVLLSNNWLKTDCASPYWCNGLDLVHTGQIDLTDLSSFVTHWLDTNE